MPPQKALNAAAWTGLALMGLMWGGSFLAIELMLRQIPVETLVALRVTGGALALWAYVLVMGLPVPRTVGPWIAFLLIGGINVAMPFGLITWGQQHITSGLAGILNATTAILGPLVATLAFADERLGARKAAGVTLGFLGVATIIGLEALHSFDMRSAGQMALIGASMCYAIGAALARVHLTDMRLEVSAAGMIAGAAVWMVPVALWRNGLPDFTVFTPTTWGAWAYISVFSTALAYLILFRVIKSAGSGNATLVTLFVAPVSVVLGALVLGETLRINAYFGFALIAAGLLVIDGRLLRLFAPAPKA
ncbi:DMT family transporter [Celeribacter arenosi]|uniref:DMT family transporter n=1 Tax=Celeribacter arenosi TaxID=792649 RepID=A0ABP7KHD8_9RHOB